MSCESVPILIAFVPAESRPIVQLQMEPEHTHTQVISIHILNNTLFMHCALNGVPGSACTRRMCSAALDTRWARSGSAGTREASSSPAGTKCRLELNAMLAQHNRTGHMPAWAGQCCDKCTYLLAAVAHQQAHLQIGPDAGTWTGVRQTLAVQFVNDHFGVWCGVKCFTYYRLVFFVK